jgi:hypothetical protein
VGYDDEVMWCYTSEQNFGFGDQFASFNRFEFRIL